MKSLRIGIIGTRGIPNQYGGFERFAEYLAEGLVQRGHDVTVYNSSLHPYQEKEWNGVQIIHCRDAEDKLGSAGQFIYDLNCIRDARKRKFDICLHLGYTSDSIWHRRWPSGSVHIMNMDGMEWKRSKYNAVTRLFLKKAEQWAVEHAQVLVADSTRIQDHIVRRYGKQAVYIPYGEEVFHTPDPSVTRSFGAEPGKYYLLMARMEPENNIEMIIRGYLESGKTEPLYVIGSTANRYGERLHTTYIHPGVRFTGSIFDQTLLNNLRHDAKIYFHGHSVGGTNPSLLEAMACGATIAAHDNIFNHAVLGPHARYFRSSAEVAALLSQPLQAGIAELNIRMNLEKIRTIYDKARIIDAYEAVMLQAVDASAVRS